MKQIGLVVALISLGFACTPEKRPDIATSETGGAGGTAAAGGVSGSGAAATGGVSGAGAATTGGAQTAGGAHSSGGVSGAGIAGTGDVVNGGTGGFSANGGASANGGTAGVAAGAGGQASAGAAGLGGGSSTGGAAGAGGAIGGMGGSLGGVGGGTGGTPITGGTGGTGGTNPTPTVNCSTAWVPWFESAFNLPDGNVVGPVDFPKTPWRERSGSPRVESERATSTGAAQITAEQGLHFSAARQRLRAKLQFPTSDSQVTIVFNGSEVQPSHGLGVKVEAQTGALTLLDGNVPVAAGTLGALQPNSDYFIELLTDGATTELFLTTGTFASVPGATVEGVLTTTQSAPIGNSSVVMVSMQGTAGVALDDLEIAICGLPTPSYAALFRDTFSRNSGTSLGNAEIPSISAWVPQTGTPRVNGSLILEAVESARCSHQSGIQGLVHASALVHVVEDPQQLAFPILIFNNEESSGSSDGLGFYFSTVVPPEFTVRGAAFEEADLPTSIGVGTIHIDLVADGDTAIAVMRADGPAGEVKGRTRRSMNGWGTGTDLLVSSPSASDTRVEFDNILIERLLP